MAAKSTTPDETAGPDLPPGPDPEHRAFLGLVRAAVELVQEVTELVQAQGLTEPQFNALRILRGAGRNGIPCHEIGERMITRVPDVTRLVDRLERMQLAERRRDETADRRVVRVHISPQGRAVLRKLDEPVLQLHRVQFNHLSRSELRDLTRLLDKVRGR